MKMAFWLYFFMFLAFFDLHAQYPVLTPFALSLGATPTFIGWMMGIYALTHLPGNLLAGQGVDRYGSRGYMIFSLLSAGCILLLQAHVTEPWQLLILRSISGFVLAFLSPACLALLASLSRNPVHQGKLMAGHGVMHTLASVVSPAAGAFLVAQAGFSQTFQALGWLLIATGVIAIFTIHEPKASLRTGIPAAANAPVKINIIPLRHYLLPLAVSCSQGILFFELPLQAGGASGILHTGLYFSIISLGALVTLSMLFLNRYSPYLRAHVGILGIALSFFSLAALDTVPISVTLFFLGMSKGVVFPAIASLFIDLSGGKRLGTVFSLQSIAMSIGSFIGPIAAGLLHNYSSPYFLAFVLLMLVLILIPPWSRQQVTPPPVSLPTNRM
ncbi:Predicted arabinose efflux permease, MFS family [Fontibacillus panacisegetis]|uniref:Predicted arabinose efflux permease, MFS family n=1 Tax=Fontibacillus panacisegetis TaxID=670482 RepID=A0A1G7IPC1_9BACL|nr:MFS transporter [Fontibacillus panacisegetis]SDF14396.1 Predicted arabinose efflux permease, MFS family [Fontibacillus panacisegetis]